MNLTRDPEGRESGTKVAFVASVVSTLVLTVTVAWRMVAEVWGAPPLDLGGAAALLASTGTSVAATGGTYWGSHHMRRVPRFGGNDEVPKANTDGGAGYVHPPVG